MAKATAAKGDTDKKKKAGVTVKIKASKKGAKKDGTKKDARKTSSRTRDSFDGLAKLADHPLVADLLAAGALAAVAAIAEHQMNKSKGLSSSRMVKSVGKAAAAAMGKKLMGDLGAIGSAASDAVKKV